MHFLCLHGSLTSADTFSAQLGPLQQNLEADNTASFYCLNAQHSATVPPELEAIFGPPPHYRWLEYRGVNTETVHASVRSARDIVRNIPDASPEETLKSMTPTDLVWANYKDVMEYVDETLEKNPDIEGIMGYSEGACVGATYILHEQKREQETGRTRRIKCGVFFAGVPPIDSEKGFIFADDREKLTDIQTLHVIGANDPQRASADCLYNLCDPDTAHFFDTGRGHSVPRGKPVIHELGDAIRELIERTKGE